MHTTLKTRQARQQFAKRKKREERLRLAKQHRRMQAIKKRMSIIPMTTIRLHPHRPTMSWLGALLKRVAALF